MTHAVRMIDDRLSLRTQSMDLDRSRRTIEGDWCSELAPGGPYFTVSYPEAGVNLPKIDTLVYLGAAQSSTEGEPGLYFVFQDAESYYQDGDWSALSDEQSKDLAAVGAVMFYGGDAIGSIADIDGLLVLLGDLREHMRLGLGWEQTLPDDR
jgi:hypothetical protein